MRSDSRERTSQIKTSILIPTFNRVGPLLQTVSALGAQIVELGLADTAEIVVVDDGSRASVICEVRQRLEALALPFVRYLSLDRNRGAAAARNAAVRASRGALLIFIDDDIVPSPDYLAAALEVHQSHPEILVLCGNLRPLRDTLFSRYWFHFYSTAFNRPGEPLHTVAMLSSGTFSIRRELLEIENPLFDETLSSREDYDLYLRLQQKNIPVYKADAVLAFNDCRDNLRDFLRQRMWYQHGQTELVAKYGSEFLAAQPAPPATRLRWRFIALSLLVRLAQFWARWRHRLFAVTGENQTGREVQP